MLDALQAPPGGDQGGSSGDATSGDGNLYAGDTHWHSDGYGTRPVLSIKMAFYLDRVTRETGALRVIPGSHRVGEPFGDVVEQMLRRDGPGFERRATPLL